MKDKPSFCVSLCQKNALWDLVAFCQSSLFILCSAHALFFFKKGNQFSEASVNEFLVERAKAYNFPVNI